jgi:hypothetical protein
VIPALCDLCWRATPRLDQTGWLRAKEKSRSFLIARRRGGRLNSKKNSSLNVADHSYAFALPGSRFAPVRSRQGGFATFSMVASPENRILCNALW